MPTLPARFDPKECRPRGRSAPARNHVRRRRPGFWENEQGRPFVGQAGKLLEELLAGIGLAARTGLHNERREVSTSEQPRSAAGRAAACHEYLERQIDLLKPRVIVTLGRFSMAKFFGPGRGMRDLHGKTVRRGEAICLAVYHPAAALRQATLKQVLVEDFAKIPALVEQARELEPVEAPPRPEPPPEQLSLF